MQPSLRIAIQNTTHARIDFIQKEFNDFDLHVNGITRNFTSLRQMYNYLRAVHGHDAGMVVIEAMIDHLQRCKNIG